jgi:hypothetical protein
LNNCITAKENILKLLGICHQYGQKIWEKLAKCLKAPCDMENGLFWRAISAGFVALIKYGVRRKLADKLVEYLL